MKLVYIIGVVAQLVERLFCLREVIGSIPFDSRITILFTKEIGNNSQGNIVNFILEYLVNQ